MAGQQPPSGPAWTTTALQIEGLRTEVDIASGSREQPRHGRPLTAGFGSIGGVRDTDHITLAHALWALALGLAFAFIVLRALGL